MIIGKILPIKKEYSKNTVSIEACLSSYGYSRFPGTSMKVMVFKELNGKFRTGLDPDALYIKKMSTEEADLERKRVKILREELEELTGLDLSPTSAYYKEMFNDRLDQVARAMVVELKDEENIFNLSNPYEAITFAWLRVNPLIAGSYQAWERGEYPASTKFFVSDEQVESEITYKKKTGINKAIVILDTLSVEDRKKVARLLGMPVSENTKEIHVYNLLDSFIKSAEISDGKYKGQDPLTLFNKIALLDPKLLGIKDLIEQAIRYSIYREDRDGIIKEGGIEISKSNNDLALELTKSKNQDKLIALSEKVKSKKLAL